jgi:hypothetical protein
VILCIPLFFLSSWITKKEVDFVSSVVSPFLWRRAYAARNRARQRTEKKSSR